MREKNIMRILIATASRHGSTRELGHWLGSAIAERLDGAMDSVTVEVLDAADVDGIAGYDAVIIGSGVYMGRWLREARSLVKRERVKLETRPVWLWGGGGGQRRVLVCWQRAWRRMPMMHQQQQRMVGMASVGVLMAAP